jgi:hypothetical protein
VEQKGRRPKPQLVAEAWKLAEARGMAEAKELAEAKEMAEAKQCCQGWSQTGRPNGGRLAPGVSLQVFPLDGTLLGSDGSPRTAQHSHPKNGM